MVGVMEGLVVMMELRGAVMVKMLMVMMEVMVLWWWQLPLA